ncbi:hypothetical protein D3C86_2044480 [compost metagenome]
MRQPRSMASRAWLIIAGIACAPFCRSISIQSSERAAQPKKGMRISSFLAI